MLVLTAVARAARAARYALARWDRAGVHFHPLFQIQLMGLNGAFLTGDLFNLFVFFEVLLAASYGLLLHGSGATRVRAGLHYIAVNLLASLLFLIGVAMLYGVTGTLNMADIARKLPHCARRRPRPVARGRGDPRRRLPRQGGDLAAQLLAGAGLRGRRARRSAALFAMMTKVGVYAVLRLWTLFFPAATARRRCSAPTCWSRAASRRSRFGAIGMLASQRLGRLAGFASSCRRARCSRRSASARRR